ncbi:MAG: dialkylresorcinol condensing enzyme [Gammaproteobacteria bacterium]|nr:dialkylresorcinol condensing enzyme [Gammaproteobacteria bacterium]MBU6508763.1 dialkylresorcinol condensing enzyme [Gammaproteobacteria bacterium]MDE1983069.1 dialkylresorcinol condensing enzyme [Gammaproteobacteria bacterium]MDE2108187.1 dialkylresorcinol condensing enzyme [Gammaproteobacteria bacterium]MDE2459786.1 dialkylresorcinol condensing enzyme [Gammaproteobacteria bacterium]
MTPRKVLVVHYASPSGQLREVIRKLSAPLAEAGHIEVRELILRPKAAYPFPWPVLQFFDTFPECIYLDPPELEPLGLDGGERFDLVILGYQVWFLSPSLPTTAFLKNPLAQSVLKDTPVVTVIACRDMWLMAQERVKELLAKAGARLVGNVVLVDEAGSLGSFLATPLWMLTGKRGPRLGGLIPRAGVKPEQIDASRRFGERIAQVLSREQPLDAGLLRDLGAVRVNTQLIATERAARRSFLAWGALLRKLGKQGSRARQPVVMIYIVFLVLLLITVLPASALLKTLTAPLLRARIAAQRAYFSEPSGS